MDTDKLVALGLTKGEAKVYKFLLAKRSKVTEIVSATGLYRANLYEILDRLIEKGLVSSFTENNTKVFEATDPESIMEFLDSQKRAIEEKEKEASQLIPMLKAVRPREDVSINVFRGRRGLILVHEDMLKQTPKRGEIIIFGAELRSPNYLGKYYDVHHKKREAKQITHRLVCSEKMRPLFKKHPQFNKPRYIPKEFVSGVNTYIYGNKVAFVMWEKEMVVVIENKDIVESYTNYFNLMWKWAKP